MNRREAIALTPDEQRQYLQDAKTIILCTLDREGYPHAVAMWFLAEHGAFYMTSFKKAQKVLNMRRNPKVTLLVESGLTYDTLKGLMIRGRAELIDDTDACIALLVKIHQKMGGALVPGIEEAMRAQARKRVLIKITPERQSSWDHSKLGGVY